MTSDIGGSGTVATLGVILVAVASLTASPLVAPTVASFSADPVGSRPGGDSAGVSSFDPPTSGIGLDGTPLDRSVDVGSTVAGGPGYPPGPIADPGGSSSSGGATRGADPGDDENESVTGSTNGGVTASSLVDPVARLTLDWPGKPLGQGYVLPGDAITLDASASYDPDGEISTYAFDTDFDDEYEVLESTDPVHEVRYHTEGYYTVWVRVTDDVGDTNVTFRQAFVNAPPTARFEYDPGSPVVGARVTFDGTDSTDYNGSVTGYEWFVNGSRLGSGRRFNATFTRPGDYNVTLVVSDDEDGGPPGRRERIVSVGEGDAPPEASFRVSPRPSVAGNRTTLDATNSTDPDGRIVEYRWDFDGDGTVDRNTTDPVTTHRFPYDATGEGYAVVGLTVVDDAGNEGRTSRDLEIRPPEPRARCDVVPDVVGTGGTAVVDASSSANAGGYVFDTDGDPDYETDLLATPRLEVTFEDPGTYTLGVLVQGNRTDRTDEADCSVEVRRPPSANFSVSPRPAVAGNRTALIASASEAPDGRIVEYRWDFDGDGTVDRNTTDPITTYRFPYDATGEGYAVVGLTVVDEEGLTGRTSRDLEIVREGPTARCGVDPSVVAVGDTAVINASASTYADGYAFDTDGDPAYETDLLATPRFEVTFRESGNYTLGVRVRGNRSDRTDEADCTLRVNARPTAAFAVDPRPAVAGRTTTLNATPSFDPDGRVVRYLWDFDGDGTVDRNTTDPVVSHRFPYDATSPGLAVVEVTVVDEFGARARNATDLSVRRPELRAACTASPRRVAPGEAVTLSVDSGPAVDEYQYDRDSSGSFGDRVDRGTGTVSYDDDGTYVPRVRVWNTTRDRSATIECGSVTVETENEPPDAVLGGDPTAPEPGERVTLDATRSTDADGRIARYEWDLDDDGTYERSTTGPTLTTTFSGPGNYTVGLRVVDDDGDADETALTVAVLEPLRAACTVSSRSVAPEEPVTVRVEGSGTLDEYRYDPGRGSGFGDLREDPSLSIAYDDPGNYTVRVEARDAPTERSVVVECPPIAVRERNAPPTAVFEVSPTSPTPGDTVTFDAGGSSDPDGRVVEYRWDFDGDGTAEVTTGDPTVTRTFPDADDRTVELVVVDDDGATAATSGALSVVTPAPEPAPSPEPTIPLPDLPPSPVPPWSIAAALVGLGGATYAAKRRKKPLPHFDSDREREYATGTFEARAASESVAVRGVGFEPDVVVLRTADGGLASPETASDQDGRAQRGNADDPATDGGTRERPGPADEPNDDGRSGPTPDRTDAKSGDRGSRTASRSIGVAARSEDGIDQEVVAAASASGRERSAAGKTSDGEAISVLVRGPDGVESLDGTVEAFEDDGFRVAFDAAGLPEDAGSAVVHYQAFALPDPLGVEVGQFSLPPDADRREVPLGIEADYVALAACTLGDGEDAPETGDAVGIAHGQAVRTADAEDRRDEPLPPTPVDQFVLGGAVEAGHDGSAVAFGREGLAVHLPFFGGDRNGAAGDGTGPEGGGRDGTDPIGPPADRAVGHRGGRRDRDDGDSDVGTDPRDPVGETSVAVTGLGQRLDLAYESVGDAGGTQTVTYLALRTEAGLRPELGRVDVPDPGDTTDVDVGFDPGMVTLGAVPRGPRADAGSDPEDGGTTGRTPGTDEGSELADEATTDPTPGADDEWARTETLQSPLTRVELEPTPATPFDWSDGAAMPLADGGIAEQVLHGGSFGEGSFHGSPETEAIDPVHPGVTTRDDDAVETHGPGSGIAAAADDDGESGEEDDDERTALGAGAVVLSTGRDGTVDGLDRVNVTRFSDSGFSVRTASSRSDEPSERSRAAGEGAAGRHVAERAASGDGDPDRGRASDPLPDLDPEESPEGVLDASTPRRRGDLFYVAWPKPLGNLQRRPSGDDDQPGEDGGDHDPDADGDAATGGDHAGGSGNGAAATGTTPDADRERRGDFADGDDDENDLADDRR